MQPVLASYGGKMNIGKKEEILLENSRAVVHMREQIKLKRFGLVFGAGAMQDLGFPSWWQLIKRISEDEKVSGSNFADASGQKASISRLLFERYKTKYLAEHNKKDDNGSKLHAQIQSGWHRVIHNAIYKDVPQGYEKLKKRDRYLKEFVSIIKETQLTVNYNFDNTLETFLGESRSPNEKDKTRGYRTVWKPDIQLFPQNAVIYHPNGYLPRDFVDKPSDDLIFLDDAFGDQLIDSISGHYAALSNHFAQNTCLFVGVSLEDSTLRHLLRKNAHLHPGHVHYYVHFLNENEVIDQERKNTIRNANFEVYNLVTLFLDRNGIASLGQLLRSGDEEIALLADGLGLPTIYRFYLTGSVSVGKSTAVSFFRSLRSHDEWFEDRAPGMEKDPAKVDKATIIQQIDEWVAQQWRKKNFLLFDSKKPGIDIIDRCSLDAFAFTPEDQWISKAKLTREIITPSHSNARLAEGKVILLVGDSEMMAIRAMKLQKDVEPDLLEYRQNLLRIVYDKNKKGVVEIDTRGKSAQDVAKAISHIIHLDEYESCDLQSILESIEAGEISPSTEKKQ